MNFIDQLSANISLFSSAVGMNTAILDEKGTVVNRFGDEYRFCSLYHAYNGEHCTCKSEHCRGGLFSSTLGDCYFYLCPAKLVHFSVAITKDNRYVGSVLTGPIVLPRMERVSIDELTRRMDIGEEAREELEAALEDIPLVEPVRAYYVGKLLFQLVCSLLSQEDQQITLERRQISRQQSEIGEFLQRIGNSGNLTEVQLKQEKELSELIFNGNISGAQQLLNSIIARIYFSTGNNVDLVKIRMNELIGVLSRVVLQTNADPNDVYNIVTDFQERSLGFPGLVELSRAMSQTLGLFIDLVRHSLEDKKNTVVRYSKKYIEDNLSERLSIVSVAQHVSLSPSYFSHLFKERTGMTVSAYVNTCRIEQAKHLLRESDISLAEIAQRLGFENQQYFSRVFKKALGIPPGRFRREAQLEH